MEETKTCTKCGIERPINQFEPRKTARGTQYRRAQCRVCINKIKLEQERAKRGPTPSWKLPYIEVDRSNTNWRELWHLANAGRTKPCSRCKKDKSVREFYIKPNGRPISSCNECELERHRIASHTPEYRAYHRRWEAEHAERASVRAKQYRKDHPDVVKDIRRRFRENHLEDIRRDGRERMRTPHARELARLAHHRRNQLNDYVLSSEQWQLVLDFFNGKCAYCGSSDRIEMDHFFPLSRGGLAIMGNVVPACKSCNSSKNNKPPHEWLSHSDFSYFMTLLSSASR